MLSNIGPQQRNIIWFIIRHKIVNQDSSITMKTITTICDLISELISELLGLEHDGSPFMNDHESNLKIYIISSDQVDEGIRRLSLSLFSHYINQYVEDPRL